MRRRFVNLYNNKIGAGNASNTSLHASIKNRERPGRVKKVDAILSNADTVLAIVKDASNIGDGIPYIEPIAGLIGTIIEMKEVRHMLTSRARLIIT
jgi:hypothetical protein